MDKLLKILVAEDNISFGNFLCNFLDRKGHIAVLCNSGTEALRISEHEEFDLVISDIQLPGMDGIALLKALKNSNPDLCVIIVTAYASVEYAIEALRLGADDFLKKPIQIADIQAVLERTSKLHNIHKERKRLKGAIRSIQSNDPFRSDLIGNSKASDNIRRMLKLAAESPCPSLLITGETGVGKDVVAREYHRLSRNNTDPFIAVSCPALPESLVESELFGHLKGSFTGAVENRPGAFELAHNGTLFLDEIGDLSLTAQAKILRALETRTVKRIGGSYERSVETRIVAATHQNLKECCESGTFRKDLYYRLDVFNIPVPPLRERKEDIIPLARYFCSKNPCVTNTNPLTSEAEKMLLEYDYPGNIRELRNIIERALIFSSGRQISSELLSCINLKKSIEENSQKNRGAVLSRELELSDDMNTDERNTTLSALNEFRWNRRAASRKLGITYDALLWRIKKYNINCG
ncbi:MAG: hypothetical protein CVV64_17090 [Candidatus Wallbacteria bacterium HGW-Wallbacteria-1]|jgi:DNA-binding NtrC family response regulator|uniref:Sigma-54-dependent Fis family transcriptional regulator n=1 Tax=Candidatus Wallbacteria bacterium HGW-Wallbacteria-1 TaxID=2013854 RepID=A0A2N1PKF7_9BACT|nr:MAG: hypothetical protein CVV64_17090 [Candidatus Wallbacteria bacterium HGW-Wallbacteria-1]